jgi:U3 small nucleolar RNA-associated protein 5
MAEKLAALSLPTDADGAEEEQSAAAAVVPPSADSVHVLLRQALRADDRAALLGCLCNRDDKVSFFFLSFSLCYHLCVA